MIHLFKVFQSEDLCSKVHRQNMDLYDYFDNYF